MPREARERKIKRAAQIDSLLARYYPNPQCALVHKNPFELLIATILSAQCTDARVNQVTPGLFAAYPDPSRMAQADLEHLEQLVHPTGFFRSKALSLKTASQDLINKHGGVVPQTVSELTQLRGVGRKTANVVLGVCFGKAEGIVVDTHVRRLSNRLNLSRHEDPVRIEKDLMQLIPEKRWVEISHCLILHGRAVCVARRPRCETCFLAEQCPSRL